MAFRFAHSAPPLLQAGNRFAQAVQERIQAKRQEQDKMNALKAQMKYDYAMDIQKKNWEAEAERKKFQREVALENLKAENERKLQAYQGKTPTSFRNIPTGRSPLLAKAGTDNSDIVYPPLLPSAGFSPNVNTPGIPSSQLSRPATPARIAKTIGIGEKAKPPSNSAYLNRKLTILNGELDKLQKNEVIYYNANPDDANNPFTPLVKNKTAERDKVLEQLKQSPDTSTSGEATDAVIGEYLISQGQLSTPANIQAYINKYGRTIPE